MNSVERLGVTPIPPKNFQAESVVRLQQPHQSGQPPLSETHSPHQEPTPTPSMDMSMVTDMLARMEARFNSVLAAQQRATQASVAGAALGVLQAISVILAVRVLLLFTLAGGFFLAVSAMQHQTPISVWVLIAYSVLVIFPVSVIEHGRKIRSGG